MPETLILETRENSTTLHRWVISDGTPIINVESGLDITISGVTQKYYNSAIIYNSNYNENYIFIFGSTANTYLRVFNSSNNGQTWTEQTNRRTQISTNVGDFYRINVYNDYSGNIGALYAGTNNYIKGEVIQNPFNLPIFDFIGGEINDYINYISSPLITYQWSSVPTIIGKNGILLPLSTLNDVNNGEEITTSDTSKFNLTEASNVAKLVNNIINTQG